MDLAALKGWRTSLLVILAGECSVLLAAAWRLARFKPAIVGSAWAGFFASRAALLVPLYALTLVALWKFLGPRGRLPWGAVAMLSMTASYQIFASVYAMHHQDFFQSGAVLLGFVLGEAYARLLGVREDEGPLAWREAKVFGATGGIGMFAGTYLAAGMSKAMSGGLSWLTSSTLRLMVLAHTEVDDARPGAALMHWIAASPRFCMLLEASTLVIQLGAFMLIVGPRARRVWAALIVAFHLGIYFSSNILFLQALLFAMSLAFPWAGAASLVRRFRGRGGEVSEVLAADERPALERGPWLALTVATIALLWIASSHR